MEISYIPEKVILDLRPEITAFNEMVKEMTECEAEINEVMENILAHIADGEDAEEGVEFYADFVYHTHARQDFLHDGAVLAAACLQLGLSVKDHIAVLGLRDHIGMLEYRHSGWLDKGTVILIRGSPLELD